MADRFYVADALPPGELILTGAEAHHLGTVRRFQVNDTVVLFNGDGHDYPATILACGKKQVVLQVADGLALNRERQPPVVIAAAIPKGDRAEWMIEKLVELGAARFIPLHTQRSVVQPRDAKREKWERLVIEASKQCGRNVLMPIEPPHTLPELLKRTDLPRQSCIAHTTAAQPLPADPGGRVVAIGPEGGFATEEVHATMAVGWQCVSFGPTTLRVETAALAACCSG